MFEIHATVIKDNVDKFKRDCSDLGCKPLLIELQNKKDSYQQLMTSQSFKHSNWDEELKIIKDKLEDKGYSIIRLKVEINPYAYSNVPIKYYETHFRIKVSNNTETLLEKISEKMKFHKSKNVFKKIDNDFYYQMATYRTYDLNIKKFENIISSFKNELINNNFEFDKVEVEACIIDTNDTIDKKWLENNDNYLFLN